jgi:hypothetical protein
LKPSRRTIRLGIAVEIWHPGQETAASTTY